LSIGNSSDFVVPWATFEVGFVRDSSNTKSDARSAPINSHAVPRIVPTSMSICVSRERLSAVWSIAASRSCVRSAAFSSVSFFRYAIAIWRAGDAPAAMEKSVWTSSDRKHGRCIFARHAITENMSSPLDSGIASTARDS